MLTNRVLYIEDNLQNRRLVRKLLRLNGYEMLEAEDGLQGIAMVASERPDLILMDINLPGIDGMEATARLKSSPELRHIPIVAVTAAAMRGDRERIMASGCDAYMQKPIDNQQLMDIVRSYIGAGAPVEAPAMRVRESAAPTPVKAPQPVPVMSVALAGPQAQSGNPMGATGTD